MMEKLAQPGEGVGGARLPSFTLSTITSKFVVYSLAEKVDTLLLFLLHPYCVFAHKSWGEGVGAVSDVR
jgi:hypothetical protein